MSERVPIKHISAAIRTAAQEVKENREAAAKGIQRALKCRWPKINNILLGGWTFRNQYAICGASGSGKSYYLNLLYQDFCNQALNQKYPHKFIILHFNFEMASSDEVLRTTSTMSSLSYRKLISTDTPLGDGDYQKALEAMDKLKHAPIYFVEAVCTVQQIYETIKRVASKYPNRKLIIGLDHTLLTEMRNEGTEISLITHLSRMLLGVRKELDSMNLLVCQLNSEIERPERIANAHMHAPVKRDIHGAKAVYRDADFVAVLHAPEQLGIQGYTANRYETKDLIAFHFLKGRKVPAGVMVRLRNELERGSLTQWAAEEGAMQLRLGVG